MALFDSHAHLSLERFGGPQTREIALERAHRAGVRGILVPGVEPADWPVAAGLARNPRTNSDAEWPSIFVAFGLHPWFAAQHDFAQLDRWMRETPTVPCAIGETGLHFNERDENDRRAQERCLVAHIQLARRLDLPLVLHVVGAHGRMVALLKEHQAPPSVIHSFTGAAELARTYVRLGHYISFSGSLTMPAARRVKEAARLVPADRLLIETDCPDQTPHGRSPTEQNEPAFVADVALALAAERGEAMETIRHHTFVNAVRLFRLDGRIRVP